MDFIDMKCANTTLREDVRSKLEESKQAEEGLADTFNKKKGKGS